jgi:ribosomal protein S27AE
MDILLLFYIIILISILLFPFLYLKYSNSNQKFLSEDVLSRKILMENLRDLKAEYDTGKLKLNEFEELSKKIVNELDELDKKLVQDKSNCLNCGNSIILNSKFCHACGKKIT